MGGKEINQQTLNEELMKTDNPYSDLVNTPRPKTIKEREAEVIARFEKENKEAAQRIKNRKMVEEAIDNSSPGFAGDRKYDAQLVADDLADKRFGKEFYDLDQKLQMDLYDEALEGLADQKRDIPDPEDFATGGRAGFAGGSYSRNSFEHKINELKSAYKRYKKGSSTGGRKGILTFEQFAPMFAAENFATGGRAGFANGTGAPSITYDFDKKQESMGPNFETNDPEEALKEIVRRMINVEPAKIPLSKDMQLMFDLDRAQIGGSKDIGGGELNFGINKGFGRDDTGIGFQFRKQFKDGSGMTRRSFLKILGGLAAIPIVGKFLKPLKTAKGIKSVPIIKTDNVAGKPEWFDALVNKVIIEGDDVTKKFATADRQAIHQKTLDDGSVVRVTEDVDDGAIRVEYESVDNMYEDTVQLRYKKPLPDEGAPNPAAEFDVAESGPVGRQTGPDDFDIDVDEVGGSSISDLDSDVSKLKEFATGKKPTIREIIQNKKRKDKVKAITKDSASEAEEVVRRQGDFVDDNAYQYSDPGAEGFASGGIARMLGE